jgi:hypothetical protein
MSDVDDKRSTHSGTSVPSIGEDAQDPQVRHLIVGDGACRAIYRSSHGCDYICPRLMNDCHKRNYICIRATNRGAAAIYEIDRGVRGAFRGVFADRPLAPEDHARLMEEARERNRANAALAAGVVTLEGGPVPEVTTPEAATTPPVTTQTPAEQLIAMITRLQEMLRVQTLPATRAAPTEGIPADITVTTPLADPPGSLRPTPPLVGPVTVPPPLVVGPVLPAPAPATLSPPPPPSLGTSCSRSSVSGPGGCAPSLNGISNANPGPNGVNFVATTATGASPIDHVSTASAQWYVILTGRVPGDTGVYDNFVDVSP